MRGSVPNEHDYPIPHYSRVFHYLWRLFLPFIFLTIFRIYYIYPYLVHEFIIIKFVTDLLLFITREKNSAWKYFLYLI